MEPAFIFCEMDIAVNTWCQRQFPTVEFNVQKRCCVLL